jgi:hypothetical protein
MNDKDLRWRDVIAALASGVLTEDEALALLEELEEEAATRCRQD